MKGNDETGGGTLGLSMRLGINFSKLLQPAAPRKFGNGPSVTIELAYNRD